MAVIGEKLQSSSWRGAESDVVREAPPTQSDHRRTYVSLHHHTTFSFLDGYGLPKHHAEQAAVLGSSALAITDHGNVSGHVQHRDKCLERNVKPIFGCELYTGGVGDEANQRKNHLTVLAMNVNGYRNLNRMVTESWEHFYYYPTVGGSNFKAHHEGLMVLSGCTASLLATSMVGGKLVLPEDASYKRARQVAGKFKELLGDRYFLEVQPFSELDDVCRINQAYEKLSKDLNIPLVATGDVHVPKAEDSTMRQLLHACRPGKSRTMDEVGQEWDYSVPAHLMETDNEVYKRLRATGLSKAAAKEAIENTAQIADRCNVDLPSMPMVRYPTGDVSSEELFMTWLRQGWTKRGCNQMSKKDRDAYADRVRYEVSIIGTKDYFDYFLIVSDMVRWAKDQGIAVGPGRGSVAASLVAWLLQITEVNPMLYPHLVFERFIDITREDLPDIDLDFDSRRDEVRQYLVEKYGEDKVGNMITFVKYKGKNSLDDVARVYQIPKWEVDSVKELMVERSGGDLRASATIEDTVEYFDKVKEVFDRHEELWLATKLEGNLKGMGMHAAGIVIGSRPITDVCATYTRKVAGNEIQVISMDKYDAEKVGLLKLDNLGLSTMDVLNYCRQKVGMTLEEMYAIPLDDAKTLAGFQSNDVTGIFQFDGWAMQLVNSILQPDTFLEVCDVGALARPGPLHNGSVNEYVEVKLGRKEPRRYHPIIDKITESTNYQIVYQEQILRIVMEVGGFDWTHAAEIRRIISRRMGEQEFNRQGERFITGALERGLSEDDAREIWGACITAGSYAFNSAHAVSYGLLGWWTMWFKQHHPAVFFAASLHYLGTGTTNDKQERLLQDAAKKHNLDIVAPHPKLSGISWEPWEANSSIIAGFSQIDGIGEKTAEAIIQYRDEVGVDDWDDLINVKGIGPKTIEKIKDFVEQDDPFGIYTLSRRLDTARALIASGDLPLPEPTHTSIEIPYQSTNKDLHVVWLGTIFYRNLRDLFEVNMSRTGIPLDPDKVKNPELREWVILYGRDETDHMYVSIDRWKYPRFRDMVWGIEPNYDLVLIKGIKRGNQMARRIYVKEMWVIDPQDEMGKIQQRKIKKKSHH